jgi:ComF family protein
MQLRSLPRQWLHHAGALMLPHRCPSCGRMMDDAQTSICLRCLTELPVTGFFRQTGNPVEMLFWGRTPIDAAGSLFFFTRGSSIQRILHALKYKGNQKVGIRLGRSLGDAIARSNRFRPLDGIIPLPLHSERLRMRGYNQATCIAEGVSLSAKKPVLEDVVKRLRQTDTQTKKNRIDRWTNLSGGFSLTRPENIAGKNILLVDDVVTTGASLEACAHTMLQAKPAKLYIATIAYASQ